MYCINLTKILPVFCILNFERHCVVFYGFMEMSVKLIKMKQTSELYYDL